VPNITPVSPLEGRLVAPVPRSDEVLLVGKAGLVAIVTCLAEVEGVRLVDVTETGSLLGVDS
jgi:hypothetical protein